VDPVWTPPPTIRKNLPIEAWSHYLPSCIPPTILQQWYKLLPYATYIMPLPRWFTSCVQCLCRNNATSIVPVCIDPASWSRTGCILLLLDIISTLSFIILFSHFLLLIFIDLYSGTCSVNLLSPWHSPWGCVLKRKPLDREDRYKYPAVKQPSMSQNVRGTHTGHNWLRIGCSGRLL
jgi:hypothetical protein